MDKYTPSVRLAGGCADDREGVARGELSEVLSECLRTMVTKRDSDGPEWAAGCRSSRGFVGASEGLALFVTV
jgi:hypothetical protein